MILRYMEGCTYEQTRAPQLYKGGFGLLLQFLEDVFGKMVFNLIMARYRLAHAGFRVLIPIMLSAVAYKSTAEFLDLSDQLGSLHAI